MKKNLVVLVIAIFAIFNTIFANNARVVLDAVKVNDKAIEKINEESLVFAEKDKIEILYHLEADIADKTPFRFLTNLRYQDQEYTKPTNTTSILYTDLKENKYELIISALDPRNQLNASPLTLNFRVNNKEVELQKLLKQTNKKLANADSLLNNTKSIGSIPISGGINLMTILISVLSAAALIILAIIFKNKLFNKSSGKSKMTDTNFTITKEEYEALLKENSDLKTEIQALRTQIDNLNVRSQELNTQNKDLKEKADKLSVFNTELEELQKQKDDLFAMVIHDIKNPAGLIKSLVGLLESYDLSAVEQREIIGDIVTTTNKIVNLSQEVTKILALESSAMHLSIEDWDLSEIVKDVVKRNSIASNQKEIEVLLEIKKLPFIPVDAQKVDEVIDNLLSNAIKFSPKGGKIKVTLKKEGDFAEISVKDNGLGLSQEDISKAFQRGVKLSAQPTANEHSSGFGLWIVKKLVEAHTGRVRITSALGKGSTFSVLFPLKQTIVETEDNVI